MSAPRTWMHEQFTEAQKRKVELDKFNAEQTDWYATCPKCKASLRGTIAHIREHKCGE